MELLFKIVVCDDDADFLDSLCNKIAEIADRNNCKCEITKLYSGSELIGYCKNHSVDIILTDIDMPDISNTGRYQTPNMEGFKAAKESNESMHTKTPSMKELMQNLSGGNQQKVLIARWLLTHPDILILDEPTRGIDVGAKYEIYTIMHDLIKEGKSIIMISSEMPELLGMADRVMVMCEGRVTGFLDREEADSVSVMRLATKFM